MMACPFNVPTLEWDKAVAYIRKCTFCDDRQEDAPANKRVNDRPLAEESLEGFQGGQRTPACAKVCPTGAIQFGDRDQLIAEAGRRIAKQNVPQSSWRYVDHIYGLNEVGGTAWLYLSNVPFERLGFRTDLGDRPYPEYTRLALDAVPMAVLAIGAALGGAYWISQRRSRLAKAAKIENAEDADSTGATAHDP
jgi:formate dehydrogenase iron-sulfur subunit